MPSQKHQSYGSIPRDRAWRLLAALTWFANGEGDTVDPRLVKKLENKIVWQKGETGPPYPLVVKDVTKIDLADLIQAYPDPDPDPTTLSRSQAHRRVLESLQVLSGFTDWFTDHRTVTQGGDGKWRFTLTLWFREPTPEHRVKFQQRWESRYHDGDTASQASPPTTPTLPSADISVAPALASPMALTPLSPVRVFLSYKRGSPPDEPLALALCQALEADQHQVFMDLKMAVGTRWVERIEQEIAQADVMIVLLSESAICSEMVQREMELARQSQVERQGLPRILPVRVAYEDPFSYPLSEYLNPLNWAIWHSPADTPRLIQELNLAIAGQDLPITPQEAAQRFIAPLNQNAYDIPTPSAPFPLESPDQATMLVGSRFYVERPQDIIALEAIQQPSGLVITIQGARQMGKSSLLCRVVDMARREGKQVAYIDFQGIDSPTLQDADAFFQQFCLLMTYSLDLDEDVATYWQRPNEGNLQRCTRYMGKHILSQIDTSLVLAMDEVDKVFSASFRDDFFGMLRTWHNKRAMHTLWQRLDLVLVTSTEPFMFIDKRSQSQSPFNVGEKLTLGDFSPPQVADLNQRHGQPLSARQVEQLATLVHGHPYLVRRALYMVASQHITPEALFREASQNGGPFDGHLKNHLSLLHQTPELMPALAQVVRTPTRLDDDAFYRLQGAGLVRRDRINGKEMAVPRCPLYANYFREHLRG